MGQGTDILKNRQDQKRAELDEVLKEYIAEWRKQRVKEEEELKKLKEKQARRKVFRAEEDKNISLSFRIKKLNIDGLGISALKTKATELWEAIVLLETEKYDLEERSKRQDYDLKELKERQKQQLRHKALKRGLDPEALTGKYPPKIQLASKFERRVDHRTYTDKMGLFAGGWDVY